MFILQLFRCNYGSDRGRHAEAHNWVRPHVLLHDVHARQAQRRRTPHLPRFNRVRTDKALKNHIKLIQSNPLIWSPDNGSFRLIVHVWASPILWCLHEMLLSNLELDFLHSLFLVVFVNLFAFIFSNQTVCCLARNRVVSRHHHARRAVLHHDARHHAFSLLGWVESSRLWFGMAHARCDTYVLGGVLSGFQRNWRKGMQLSAISSIPSPEIMSGHFLEFP